MLQQKWYDHEGGLRLLFSVMRRRIVWQICAKGSEQLFASFFKALPVAFLPVFPLRLFQYCIDNLSFDSVVSLFPGTYFNIILPSNSRPPRLFCFFQNFWQLFITYVIHGSAHLVLFVFLITTISVEHHNSWSYSQRGADMKYFAYVIFFQGILSVGRQH